MFNAERLEKYLIEKGLISFNEKQTFSSIEECILAILDHNSARFFNVKTGESVYHYSNRTVGEIFRTVKNYFPESTILDVYKSLINLIKNKKLISWICKHIGKRTYSCTYPYISSLGHFQSEPVDEFGMNFFETFSIGFKEGPFGTSSVYGFDNTIDNLILENY